MIGFKVLGGVYKWDGPAPGLPMKPSTRFQIVSVVTIALLSLQFQNIFSNSVRKNLLASLMVVHVYTFFSAVP